ncbi:MAG: leucine-rich repeat domain-containing protein, partial [Clostridia bacterium]|nr:leucine-rich repeat domain-containing protein [Clostridia bacterium]
AVLLICCLSLVLVACDFTGGNGNDNNGNDNNGSDGENNVTTEILKFTETTDGYIVSGLEKSDETEITIPATYKGKPVISIGEYAFEGCEKITGIVIPNSITAIEEGAFEGCIGFESFIIPNSVTTIGESAFAGCNSLESIVIPDNVTHVGFSAFEGCTSLESITLPFTGEEYGSEWSTHFSFIFGARSYDFSNDYVPESLKSVVLSNKFKTIEYRAFSNCSNIVNITIPTNTTSIGNAAFYKCSSIANITIPNSTTTIGSSAFASCSNLTTIHLPDSITNVGNGAFSDCINLTNINIPNNLNNIGETVFYNCNKLQYNDFDNALYLGNDQNPYLLLVKAKSTDITTCTINEKAKYILDGAFRNCRNLASINIPDNVTTLKYQAFGSCTNLSNVTMGNVITIESEAFTTCSKLTSINLPKSVTTISDTAFKRCNSITSISVDNDNQNFKSENNCLLTKDGSTLVLGCKTSTIPESVNVIGKSSFYGSSDLTRITIPSTVTKIDDNAFYNCTRLVTFNYNGTKAQWNAIEKAHYWDHSTGNYTVICTDGKLDKNGNEIE